MLSKAVKFFFLSKYITSQCSKLSACLSSIQSGKLVIMFLIPGVLVDCLILTILELVSELLNFLRSISLSSILVYQ